MTTLAAYLRVSTRGQADDGQGLDLQRQAITEWAVPHGCRLSWFSDEGVSGSEGLDTRQGLFDALATLRDNQCEGLVVYRLDRLARDLVLQEQLLAEVKRIGGTVFSTSSAEDAYLGDDPDDPSRKLIRQVLGCVAEYERSMIRLRLRSGRRRKAERGGYIGGLTRYGYRAENGELVPDDDEQATVLRIAELRSEGLSYRIIADTLNAEGRLPKRSDTWFPQTVGRIVKRLQVT